MALTTPAKRSAVHRREIHCVGYLRDDGLWDVEGRLLDMRAFSHVSVWNRTNLPASKPVHEMWIRLTIDATMTIRAVELSIDHSPCPPFCERAGPNYEKLVGLRISAGFRKQVNSILRKTEGCTHVSKLLDNLATVAFQSIESQKLRAVPDVEEMSREQLTALFSDEARPDRHLKPQVNGCITYEESGPAMKELWPDLYKGEIS